MTIVKIREREFKILSREELEARISELYTNDVYWDTFKKYREYQGISGAAYTYISAVNGEVRTTWLPSNTFNHPWDDFDEIVLCSIDTQEDFNSPEFLLSDEEKVEFDNYEGDAESFIIEKYGEEELEERYRNVSEWLATEYGFDWESIDHQLDVLYSYQENI